VVTICTTRFNTKNSTFCPYSVFVCFVWIWEQTAIISLYSINWLVFITETESVYCAVRAESVYAVQGILAQTVDQVVSDRPRRPVFVPSWDLWWRKWHRGRFLSQYFGVPLSLSLDQCGFPPVNVFPPMPHTHLHLDFALNRRTKGPIRGTFHNASEIGGGGGRWGGGGFLLFLTQTPPLPF